MDHLQQATQQTFNNSQNINKLFFENKFVSSCNTTISFMIWILSFLNKFIIGLCYELCWLYCREQRQCRQDNMNIIPIYYLCCTGMRPAWSHPFLQFSHCLVVILHYWLWRLVAKSVDNSLSFQEAYHHNQCNVKVYPVFSPGVENCSPADMQTMFHDVWQYHTQPRHVSTWISGLLL